VFTAADIRDRLRGQPFVPLRIITSSGQSYDVFHPDMLLVGRRDLIIGMPSTDDPGVYEQVSRVAVLHITDLQDLPSSHPPQANGTG
jgi:hypothetical protein